MLSVYEPLVSRLTSRKIVNIRSDTLSEQCCLNSSVRVRVRVSCSSSKFRPLSIYLQLLVYIVYLFIHIFRGKLRPVAISRSTLVYAYRTMRPLSIYLQLLVYIVYLFIHIFRGKLRPVAISRSTLVYAYRTMRPNSNSN